MTHKQNADARLDELIQRFDRFVEQYERDMRGDKNVSNGNAGLVGEIRKLKETLIKYPSLTWLFAHRPFQTVTVIVGVYIGLTALSAFGLLRLFSALLGLRVP